MKRVEITFSFSVEDFKLFCEAASKLSYDKWGSPLEDLVYAVDGQSVEDATIVQAAVEHFIASNGDEWPPGVASDANLEYHGWVREEPS